MINAFKRAATRRIGPSEDAAYALRPTMKKRISFGHAMAATFLAITASMSGTAAAQPAPASSDADKWQFTAGLYGYFATIKGTILSGTSSTDIPT